jgi:uncharacterized protein (DUF885 family)
VTSELRARRNSPVDRIADGYLDQSIALDPLLATQLGVDGFDHLMPDLSPEGIAARADLDRAVLDQLTGDDVTRTADDTDRVTVAALRERLGLQLECYAAGEIERELNVIASPVQYVRSIFDLMKTDTVERWRTVAARLAAVPQALDGYRRSLGHARDHGNVAARRQVEKVATECDEYSADEGFFASLAANASVDAAPVPDSVGAELAAAAAAANAAYRDLAQYLRAELLPAAPERDAVGRDRYDLASRFFLGATVDFDETYEWGLAELARLEAEMAQVADQIVPGGDVAAAVEALDADPARVIHGKEAFRDWMQQLADRTLAELADSEFDIPAPVRRIECRIAPTTTGGIYYTAPSEDFSRPGAMWWAVPAGVEDFSTWREITTVYHEGVPGHHLQNGQTAYRADLLNRWRRLGCWVSGHGEGWALYAERLMADLGYLDDPGARLGMLDGQGFRAASAVVDIGVHLGLAAPEEVGGGTWDADKAWTFLRAHTRIGTPALRFELDRYLGWPGHAPSYKVGERIWMQLRQAVRDQQGGQFDLKAFHRRALDVGSVGLDVLRDVLVRPAG